MGDDLRNKLKGKKEKNIYTLIFPTVGAQCLGLFRENYRREGVRHTPPQNPNFPHRRGAMLAPDNACARFAYVFERFVPPVLVVVRKNYRREGVRHTPLHKTYISHHDIGKASLSVSKT
jgi:hypothetical protein